MIEVIISAGLMVVVGMAVYASFNSGITIWKRLMIPHSAEDVGIFFEKIGSDLKNSFVYEGIDFIGGKETIELATLVSTASKTPGLRRGVGVVRYSFSEEDKSILLYKRNMSMVYREEDGGGQEVLKGVSRLEFKYYYYDSVDDRYVWVEEWEEESLPLAVSLQVEVISEGKPYAFTKTINLPLSTQ